jgi:hypothetical protein
LPKRDVDRARHGLHAEFHGLAHVEQESLVGGIPVADRHVAAKNIRSDHAREIDRILANFAIAIVFCPFSEIVLTLSVQLH